MKAHVAAFVSLLVVGAASRVNAAEPASPRERIGVLKFDGRSELPVRRQLQQALGLRGYEVVATRKLERTARELGVRLDDDADRRRVMTALRLTAVVRGRVAVAGGRATAWLTIERDAGGPPLERTWTVDGDSERLAELVVSDWNHRETPASVVPVEAAVTSTSAAPPPSAPDEARPTTRRPALSIAAGPRFVSRRLAFSGDDRGELRDFRTRSIGQALGVDLAWFPWAADADAGFARALGFAASYEVGLGLRSSTADGGAYESPHHQLAAAALLRAAGRWVTFDGSLGVGEQAFAFERLDDGAASPDARAPVPNVRYRHARAGGELVVHGSGAFALVAGAGFRWAAQAGDIAGRDWFPRDRVIALDAKLGALVRVLPRWEVRAEAELARYGHTFGARPDDPLVASGAIDVFMDYRLSLAFVFDAGEPP